MYWAVCHSSNCQISNRVICSVYLFFPSVPFIVPSFQGWAAILCLLLASITQGHQRREGGREKGGREGAYSMTMLFSHFCLSSPLYLVPTITYCAFIKLCSHLLSFLSFELSSPCRLVTFHYLSHLLAFSLYANLSIFSTQSSCPGVSNIKWLLYWQMILLFIQRIHESRWKVWAKTSGSHIREIWWDSNQMMWLQMWRI